MAKKDDDKGNGIKRGASGKATIFDVAEHAGVSFVSVSRVFNGHPNVSKRMRDRVFQSARVVGYQPRLVSRPRMLALLVDDHVGMNGRCDKYHLCSQLFMEATQREVRTELITLNKLDLLTQHAVDGIIEVGTPEIGLIRLEDLPKVPIVFTYHKSMDSRCASVNIDYQHEGAMGISVFLKKHHRKIAVLMDEMNHWSTGERQKGIETALSKHRADKGAVTYFSLGEHGVDEVCEAFRHGQYTALLSFSNRHVLELMDHIFNHLHLKIPEEVSVVTLDNTRFCEHYHPRVSSISQPLQEMAKMALENLLILIDNKQVPQIQILKSSYHERETCRAHNGKRT